MRFRLDVFCDRKVGRKVVGVGWQDWNEGRQVDMSGRLPSQGSFYYFRARDAWRRACVLIARGARQVAVKTMQDREVGRLYAPTGRTRV